MGVKYWMFVFMTERHMDKDGRILIFDMYTKFKRGKSQSVYIQIRPTFNLYFRIHNLLSYEQRMIFELARLETFKSAPKKLNAWRLKLAKAGFYYTGDYHKYTCTCAFCGFSYDSWTEADDPEDIHRRLKPDCPFLTDRVNTHNIPIHADERVILQRRSPAFLTSSSGNVQYSAVVTGGHVSRFQTGGYAYDLDLTTEEVNSFVRQIMQDLQPKEDGQISNISDRENRRREGPSNYTKTTSPVSEEHDKPKYPDYTNRSARLDSFRNWPIHLTQSPEEMASAGFFFTGTADICRCYFCGGGLKNWDPDDQPWIEHAHWYPDCPFVRQCKGDDFKNIQMNRNLLIAITDENDRHLDLTSDTIKSVTKNTDFNSHSAVKLVLEIGFEKCLVKKAYDLLQIAGQTEINATVLLEAIFQIERNETENGYATSGATLSSEDNFSRQFQETSARSLKEENQNLRYLQTCKICLEEQISIVFLPCGHLACCENCAPALRKCPICRAFIKGTVKTYLS